MQFARIRTRPRRRSRARLYGPLGAFRGPGRRALLLRVTAALVAVFAVLGYGVTAYAQSVNDNLPLITGMNPAEWNGSAQIYDSSGKVLLATIGNQGDQRTAVQLSDISPILINATVATEDRSFWTNKGYDLQGIARAMLGYVRHHSVAGGGSTITQQLAKQMWLTPAQSLSRKVEEIALASKLTQEYSKQQILDAYLNLNPYSNQLYGVEAASQTYFGKPSKDLDLAQAALLAGIPQSPLQWDPVHHLDQSKIRQKEVLQAMVSAGYIKQSQADAAAQEPLAIGRPHNNNVAPQFVDFVVQELQNLGYAPGHQQLVVKTTLDWSHQQLAQNTVESNLKSVKYHDTMGDLASAMIALDPKTGFINAYIGSSSNSNFDYLNNVETNPGSSVKPFTYGAAINARTITMDTNIIDGPSPYMIPGEKQGVENYGGATHGVVPAHKALPSSLNIPAVKVELAVGIPKVVEYMRRLGLQPFDPSGRQDAPPADYRAALTLGGAPIYLIDEAAAYAAYADAGIYHQPESILQVTRPDGKVTYQANPSATAQQVVDAGVAYIISQTISNDANRSLAFKLGGPLNLPGRHAAAKTGTTESFTDGLTFGYTPSLVAGVWVGDYTGHGHHMDPNSDGVVVAAPAWHAFMTQALAGTPDEWYQQPSDIVAKDGSYFLKDATNIPHLPNESPSPSPSTSLPTGDGGVAGNPAAGPEPVGNGDRHGRPTPCTWPCVTPSPSPSNPFGG